MSRRMILADPALDTGTFSSLKHPATYPYLRTHEGAPDLEAHNALHLLGQEIVYGTRRVSYAECRSYGKTLGSSVRSVFALASGLAAAVIEERECAHQNYWGSVSSASPNPYSGVNPLCPRVTQRRQQAADIFASLGAKPQPVLAR